MRAKAPLDVDLEDKLIYGLTPMRLAYLVISLVGGFALWSSLWLPSLVRVVASILVLAVGAAAAWGRWRGRAIDAWIADIAVFMVATRRVTYDTDWIQRFNRRRDKPHSTRAAEGPISIVVAGRAPKAGASTVAREVATCLAAVGGGNQLWSVTKVPAAYDRRAGASSLTLSVAAVDAGRICYLDRGAGPSVAALIPEDEHVAQAAALNLATVVAFPDAPASRAFRELAGVVAATA